MRINARSKLTESDLREAAAIARSHGQDIHVAEIAVSPRGAITFYCESINGKRAVNRVSKSGGGKAATWTAWGWLIAELFRRDPEAHIGQYKGVEVFRESCTEAHEWHAEYRPERKNDLGADVSFLELVKA